MQSNTSKIQLCSGFGQYHSDNATDAKGNPRFYFHERPHAPSKKHRGKYNALTFLDILHFAEHPSDTEKSKAHWVIPHTTTNEHGRNKKYLLEHAEYHFFWVDIDSGNHSKEFISSALGDILGNVSSIIYSTKSAKSDNKKWRIILPLSVAINASRFELCQKIINSLLENGGIKTDKASESCNQLLYLPNKGGVYEYLINGGEALDPAFFDAGIAEIEAEKAKIARQHQEKINKFQQNKQQHTGNRDEKYIKSAVWGKLEDHTRIMASCGEGEKHTQLLKSAYLLGGYIHLGIITKEDIVNSLVNAIADCVKSFTHAIKTAECSADAGSEKPILADEILSYRKEKTHDYTSPQSSANQQKTKETKEEATAKEFNKRLELYNNYESESENNGYLDRKKVSDYTHAVKGLKLSNEGLIYPLYNHSGELNAFQIIAEPKNRKRFFGYAGEVKGNYGIIGTLDKENKDQKIFIVEGLSTGLSVYASHPDSYVINAVNIYNMLAVGKVLACDSWYRNKQIIFCADNDRWTKTANGYNEKATGAENIGLEIASKAAAMSKHWRITYTPHGKRGSTDFNDLHCDFNCTYLVADTIKNNTKKSLLDYVNAYAIRKRVIELINQKNAIDSRYLSYIELKQGINIIQSQIGTGKTQAMVKYSQESKSLLYIAPLIALTKSACGRLDLDVYSNKTTNELKDLPHLGTCLNSVYKLGLDDGKASLHYEYVVIDEITAIWQMVISGLINPQIKEKIISILYQVIKNAKYVVFLDANISANTLASIKEICGNDKPINRIINAYKVGTGRKVVIYDDYASVLVEATKAIESNKTAFLAFNSKKQTHKAFIELSLVTNKKGLCITGDTNGNPDVLAFFNDPNGESKKYDYIVCSPSVTTGLSIDSIDGKPAFDFVGGCFDANITTAESAVQQLGRVRDAKTIHLYVDRKFVRPGRNPDEILQAIVTNKDECKEAQKDGVAFITRMMGGQELVNQGVNALYSQIYANTRSDIEWSKYNYYSNVLRELAVNGYELEYQNSKEIITIDSAYKKRINGNEKIVYNSRILRADDINESTAKQLENKTVKTTTEHNKLEKYTINKFYGRISEEVINDDKRGRTRHKIKRLAIGGASKDSLVEKHLDQLIWLDADKKPYMVIKEFTLELFSAVGIDATHKNGGAFVYDKKSDSIKAFIELITSKKGRKKFSTVANIPPAKILRKNPIKFIGEQLKRCYIQQEESGEKNKICQYKAYLSNETLRLAKDNFFNEICFEKVKTGAKKRGKNLDP